ncbi:hypothetical protein FA95DRAFT_1610065 [Auriscalpium vulgare]|uniref:Uncharacterized protein n=1 Tax=Auriscalpium vulgare TaxID=40419 RepID=A0ACB8RF15_9AGAM|nr:hypothetical protein FA95DRAFT_1610065 [Auriscalpium vulgare]
MSYSPTAPVPTYPTLNVSAIVGRNGASAFECWALTPGFEVSSEAGTAGAEVLQLGDLANASYSVLPPRFAGGPHHAPRVQYVLLLSGAAHVTLPNSTADMWVFGGAHGLHFAADVEGVSAYGHVTDYPSGDETRSVQIPTAGGVAPPHEVLHAGPCEHSMQLRRSLADLD